MLGAKLDGSIEVGYGLLVLFQLMVDEPPAKVGVGTLRFGFDGPAKESYGSLELAPVEVGQSFLP